MNDKIASRKFRALTLCALSTLAVCGLALNQIASAQPVPGPRPGGPPGAGGPPPGGKPPDGTGYNILGPNSFIGLPAAPANAAKPNKDPRDFEGVYVGRPIGDPFHSAATYTPLGAKRAARRIAIQAANLGVKAPPSSCRPYDAVFNASQPVFPVTIVQNSKRLVIDEEEGRTIWEIFLDSGHPAHIVPSYNANSAGHWEGNTLVVDMTGWNGKSWLDLIAGPNSAQTHVIARITKNVANGDLNFDVTVTDPTVYAAPHHIQYALVWHPGLQMHEFDCESGVGVGTFPGVVDDTDEHPYIVPKSMRMSAPPGPPPPGAPPSAPHH